MVFNAVEIAGVKISKDQVLCPRFIANEIIAVEKVSVANVSVLSMSGNLNRINEETV